MEILIIPLMILIVVVGVLSTRRNKVYDFRGDLYEYIPVDYQHTDDDSFRRDILSKVNVIRDLTGEGILRSDLNLTKLAEGRCREMIEEGIGHQVADEFALLFSKGADNAGENVGYGNATPEGIVNAWVKSPEHFQNMINPNWIYTGIGIVKNNEGRRFFCQLFVSDKEAEDGK